MKTIADFVKEKRNEVNFTREDFSERAGGSVNRYSKNRARKKTNFEKVNQVLKMFGYALAPLNASELSKNDH